MLCGKRGGRGEPRGGRLGRNFPNKQKPENEITRFQFLAIKSLTYLGKMKLNMLLDAAICTVLHKPGIQRVDTAYRRREFQLSTLPRKKNGTGLRQGPIRSRGWGNREEKRYKHTKGLLLLFFCLLSPPRRGGVAIAKSVEQREAEKARLTFESIGESATFAWRFADKERGARRRRQHKTHTNTKGEGRRVCNKKKWEEEEEGTHNASLYLWRHVPPLEEERGAL